jgi:NAD+ synthase (glutamine-hydrolysing)
MRIALAQVNPTVGDLAGNADLIARVARSTDADLIVFPEMVLTGYPIEDLALRPSFQAASKAAMEALAASLHDVNGHLVVGYLDSTEASSPGRPRGGPVNAAAVIHNGQIIATYFKHHLPNYGVFDEYRYFISGDTPTVIDVGGSRVAIAICEDLWQDGGPVTWARESQADLLVVINGSPYERDKDDERLALCQRRAKEAQCALAYVNMVGGQDELVFDGDSIVVDAQGEVLGRAPQFEEFVLRVDLGAPQGEVAPRLSESAEVYSALVTGLGDYVRKNGFRSVLLGLSGGIDSALVAAIACDAIGSENVYGVSMPSVYSSQHSRDDAADLAARTGLHYRTVAIANMISAYGANLDLSGLAEENLQARVRGATLMAISNSAGHLVLATGNKSEVSVGYSTIYGDAVGGFAPIKDVPKTLVWALSRWRNAQPGVPPIPESSITKPPSAELRPDQLDSDSLPDYEVLDAILDGYVEQDAGVSELVSMGFDPETVARIVGLTDAAEYKRRQYPPGTKISRRAFGRDRRLPITNRWRDPLP